MKLWTLTQTQPATLLVFMLGAVAFVGAVLLKRLSQARGEQTGDAVSARRDPYSLVGVILQMIGISMASGPTQIAGHG